MPVSAQAPTRAWPLRGWHASLLIIVSWIFAASSAVAGDASPLMLEHLTTADGLPQATVMATLQDSQGFVWLGTEDGLVRYDGQQLYRYAASRGERNALSGNFIWEIGEDSGHDLWLAVRDGGLARWHRSSDTFTVYRHDPQNPASLASDSVRAILLDAQGRIWVGTSDAGVDILDPQSGRIEHLRHDRNNAASLSSDRIFALSLSLSGDVWIGTEAGLDQWNTQQRSISRFGPAAGAEGSLSGKQVSRILEDQSGSVWVASFDAGLTRLDRDGRLLETFRHDARQADSLISNDVRALLEDRDGRLWVGTADGLELLDRSSGRFTHFRRDDSNADSLRDSYVMSLYQDQAGLIWIGTRTGGVSRWNPRSWEFGGHRPKWLGSGPVTAFADARDNRMWIASFDGGLVQFNTDTGEMTPVDQVLGRKVLGDEKVMSLRQDHLGTLWVGSSAGIKKITADGRIEAIPVKAGDARATSVAGSLTIVESRSGQIWIGTFGGGVNVLDPATGVIRQLPYGTDQPGAVSSAEVSSIAEDSHGNLWIGTMNGLNLAGADGRVRKVFQNNPRDPQSLPGNTIYAITIDAQDRVWIAAEGGGLAQVVGSAAAPESIQFKTITRAQGLSSDTLYGVVADAAGDLWLSGNAGLMRFNPETGAIKAYHREHGLQGEEFAFGAYYRLRDGRVCFGGPGGFNIFDPAQLTENRQPPRLALTNVDVLGVRMQSATPFWQLTSIPLAYRDSIVSLDFGVLDFGSLQHNRLAYRMPGLTDEWIDVGSQRRITLTTLPAGDHVLEVRASSSDSVWSPQPLTVTIKRDPAPWESRWAYAAYVAILLSLLIYRARQQRRKFQAVVEQRARLESEVQLRTRELVESNRQLAEAAQAKSNFLDRMSHELRTPMNGVVGMTELLSRTALSATQSHLTQTIRSSAQILLQIVNDLLDLSKIRAGKVALEALPIDLRQVLEECTSLFAGAAENKGIELIVCPPAQGDPVGEQVLLGDPLRVRQIVMNLVGNAVKFTSQGEVVVRADVSTVATGRAVAVISVTDTGIGMDAAAVKRIFEPFSQADETTTRKFGGTGLGLSICRELADLMGGEIAVESTPQIGSTFHLSLPLAVAATSVAAEITFPRRDVRILTRRPSLKESLSRHAAAFGLSVTADEADLIVLDVSTHYDDLKLLLAGRSAWPGLIVIATAAEVEAHDLRVLIDEKRIILKPVHRIALREALAAAVGVTLVTSDEPRSTSGGAPTLKGHVLLVEDEPVNAAVAEGYLAALGCTSVWVKSGTDAVARQAAERFDLVLMDLNMPDMDGFTATRLMRQREGQGVRIPIVALTAHDAITYRDKCLRADMDDILTKPYTLDDCGRLLRKWLVHEKDASSPSISVATPLGAAPLASVDATAVASLRRLRAGTHTDLYTKLVELFRIGSTESLAQLKHALAAKDLPAAAAICHKLASSASNVGALTYGREVRRLEQLCVAGDHAQAQPLHEKIQAAHAPLLDELLARTLRASA